MVYSLITLYPSVETEFTTNGLGSLGEAVSCTVTEEANGAFELEMVYPITGKRYKDLTNRRIIFAKPNPVDQPQPFRIYEISRPMNGLVTFYASHISYDLSGYPIKPFTAGTAVAAMAGLKTNSLVSHPFTFWTDKSVTSDFTVSVPSTIRGVLGGSAGSILDVYKGEYKFDRFLVRLYVNRGANRGVVIRYGKNLTDLEQEENCSKVYTHVIPYWQDIEGEKLVQLPEMMISTGGTYDFTNVYPLDLSYEFEEEPTVSELRTRAEKYVKDNDLGSPKVSLNVSFAQLEQTEEYKHLTLLERVELFDTVTVEFPEMNVSSTAKVSKTKYNVLTGRYDSVTIGSVRASISDSVIAQDDSLNQKTNEVKSDLQKAVENATKWITNGRGYMVAVKDEAGNWIEICSLDTPNIDTAVNVWRWNNGGFGHSSHGYNGPYETAITQDGHIVADFITTGSLTASIINAGILQSNDEKTFYLDLEKGILRMNATEFSVAGKSVKDIADESGKEQAKAALDAQTQKDVFNKLTDNGKTQGIYLRDGLLYINASYMEAGIITDDAGLNRWNLSTGEFKATEITAAGTFTCGYPPIHYTELNDEGQLAGYFRGIDCGYIDYSANMTWVPTGEQIWGMQIQSDGCVRMSTPLFLASGTGDIHETTISGVTRTFEQQVVTNIELDTEGHVAHWYYGTMKLDFINGICTSTTHINPGPY